MTFRRAYSRHGVVRRSSPDTVRDGPSTRRARYPMVERVGIPAAMRGRFSYRDTFEVVVSCHGNLEVGQHRPVITGYPHVLAVNDPCRAHPHTWAGEYRIDSTGRVGDVQREPLARAGGREGVCPQPAQRFPNVTAGSSLKSPAKTVSTPGSANASIAADSSLTCRSRGSG